MEIKLPIPYQPNTKDLLDFAYSAGLVEERETFILLTFATMNKVPCGVESVSGSGKSVLTDILMLLVPEEKVYRLGLSSNTATVYDFEALNKADIVYIEELQKAMNSNNPIAVELLKNMTEGKQLTRKVYDSQTKKIIKQTIKGDLGVVYALALENKQKKDDELDRRVITFMTDISQGQNRKVVRYIGKSRFNKSRLKIQKDETALQIKGHLNVVLGLAGKSTENPFAEFIANKVPVPFVKVRSYINHYFNLIDSSCKFHFKDRLYKEDKYFTSLQDIYNIHLLYGKDFNQKVHNLPQLGKDIMSLFNETDAKGWRKDKERGQLSLFQEEDEDNRLYLDVTKIHKSLKATGILLKHRVIVDQCESLVEAGFLGKEVGGKRNLFYKTDDVEEFEEKFDFKECMDSAILNMEKQFPEHINEWLNIQKDKEGNIPLYHPITGEMVYLDELTVPERYMIEPPKEQTKEVPFELIVTEEVVKNE
jgi:hypothetical protein